MVRFIAHASLTTQRVPAKMSVAGRMLATFSSQARGIKFSDVSTSSIRVRSSLEFRLEFRQSTNAFSFRIAATLVKTLPELGNSEADLGGFQSVPLKPPLANAIIEIH